jgi:hypothetical protein
MDEAADKGNNLANLIDINYWLEFKIDALKTDRARRHTLNMRFKFLNAPLKLVKHLLRSHQVANEQMLDTNHTLLDTI